MWISHWVSSPHGSWFSPEWAIQETKAKVAMRCHCDLASEVTYHHFCYVLLVTQGKPWFRMRGLHKGINTRRWGSLGAILGTGYHKAHQVAIPGTHAPQYTIAEQCTIAFTSVITFYLHYNHASRESKRRRGTLREPICVSGSDLFELA